MRNIKLKGIVLREAEYGEGNKILTVFSDTNGIISICARRAKSKNYKYLASVQTFAYSEFELYQGKSMYTLNAASLIESFYNLRNDLDVLMIGGQMLKLTSQIIQEEQAEAESLRLLLNTLHFLNEGKKNPLLLYSVFRLRLISRLGFCPIVNSCGLCGASLEGQDIGFSIRENAVICVACAKKRRCEYVEVSYDLVACMIYVCNSKLEKLFNIEGSDDLIRGLDFIAQKLVRSCLDK